jgi:hypothetical protein
MTTIILPPEVERPLAEEARKKGTTPEILAIDCLRKVFITTHADNRINEAESLYAFLSGYAGTVNGTTEALSENSGERFTKGLVAKHKRGHV